MMQFPRTDIPKKSPPVPSRPHGLILRYQLPSRFRRKKGYTGPTAQSCNRNYKAMPKDF